jgi:type I restriction enzyme S subunit
VLVEFKEFPGKNSATEVLTLTERNGFIRQADRFHKRLATEDVSKYKLVHRNDIAFNPYLLWAGAIAQNTIIDEGIISPLYPTFRVRAGYDPQYIARLLLSPELITKYDGIAFGSIPRRRRSSVVDFLNLQIPSVPTIEEQQRIVRILDNVDAIREKRKAADDKREELVFAAFASMFGDPISNRKGWPIRKFGECTSSMRYGPRFYNETYSPEGVRIVRITDLDRTGRLDFETMPRMAVSDDEISKSGLSAGDIIFARTGATVGKLAVIREEDPPCIAGAYFIRIRLKNCLEPEFAATYLRSAPIQAIITAGSYQSAQQNFSGPGLRALPCPLPPIDLQRRFSRLARQLDVDRSTTAGSAEVLTDLQIALQSRAFSGQL